jgi:ribosome biogenesis GTPase
MREIQGIIVKSVRGIYYVVGEGVHVKSKARGLFRETGETPVVGDRVSVRISKEDGTGYIEEVRERKNVLLRPPVANIDQALFIVTLRSPQINYYLLDKYLAMLEKIRVEVVLCVGKIDLISDEQLTNFHENYASTGYSIIPFSNETMEGHDEIRESLKGKTTVLVGASGVGKSTLVNAVCPEMNLETGTVSEKTGRGRHTTRHVELFEIFPNSYLFDTPGFSSLDVPFFQEPEEVRECFPEMRSRAKDCRFRDCLHVEEPGCAVGRARKAGEISQSRYDNYLLLMEEVKENKRY